MVALRRMALRSTRDPIGGKLWQLVVFEPFIIEENSKGKVCPFLNAECNYAIFIFYFWGSGVDGIKRKQFFDVQENLHC